MLWSAPKLISLALTVLLSTSLIEAASKESTNVSSTYEGNLTSLISSPSAGGWIASSPPTIVQLSVRAEKAAHKKARPRTRKGQRVGKSQTKQHHTPTGHHTGKSQTKQHHTPKGHHAGDAKKNGGKGHNKAGKAGLTSLCMHQAHQSKAKGKGKAKHHKRAPPSECKEWSEVSAMTDDADTPHMLRENGHKWYWVSETWMYTDSQHTDHMNAGTLRKISEALANKQQDYFRRVQEQEYGRGKEGKYWKKEVQPPPVIALSAEKAGEGVWILRGASNLVLKPGESLAEGEPKLPAAVKDLRTGARAQRPWGEDQGLHAEEVIAAERVWEGEQPFAPNTLMAAWEIRIKGQALGDGSQPIRACDKNCERMLRHAGVVDVNANAPDTPYQKQEREKREKTKKNKEKQKQKAKGGSGDEYIPSEKRSVEI